MVDAALLPDPSEINNKPKTDPWIFVTLHGMSKKNNGISLPAALRAAQICRYLVYSEADFEVFRPAGATRCTDGVKFGMEEGIEAPPCQISPPSAQRQGCRTPKIEIFTQI